MLHLLSLPEIVLEKILSYLTYDNIAKNRVVCKQFNEICKQLLNKGFIAAERSHSQCLKSVKSKLPRRESERKNHPMARHCEILSAMETRISLLSMTFMKYIDIGVCCFIPGKVIDEIFGVLRLLKCVKSLPRAYDTLQELRDISSMAMEYFDEKIVPGMKQTVAMSRLHSSLRLSGSSLVAGSSLRSTVFTQERIRRNFTRLEGQTKRNRSLYAKLALKVKQQANKLRDVTLKLSKKQAQIAELKKHVEDLDHKFGDLAAELSRSREEKESVTESTSTGCGTKRKSFPSLDEHLDEVTKKFKPALEWKEFGNENIPCTSTEACSSVSSENKD